VCVCPIETSEIVELPEDTNVAVLCRSVVSLCVWEEEFIVVDDKEFLTCELLEIFTAKGVVA